MMLDIKPHAERHSGVPAVGQPDWSQVVFSLNRCYAANDRINQYKHLNCMMFSDTMFASANAGKSIWNFHLCSGVCY